jgi:hypothetical protein
MKNHLDRVDEVAIAHHLADRRLDRPVVATGLQVVAVVERRHVAMRVLRAEVVPELVADDVDVPEKADGRKARVVPVEVADRVA